MLHVLYTYHPPTIPLTLPCYSVVQISELFHLLAHSGLSRDALGSISIVNCRVHMVDVYGIITFLVTITMVKISIVFLFAVS